MKIEIRDRWVKALRSGEYEQGRTMLLDAEGRYCALGVLCDTLGQEVRPFDCSGGDNHSEMYGLLADLLDFHPVMDLNDRARLSLPEIADWVEGHVLVEQNIEVE